MQNEFQPEENHTPLTKTEQKELLQKLKREQNRRFIVSKAGFGAIVLCFSLLYLFLMQRFPQIPITVTGIVGIIAFFTCFLYNSASRCRVPLLNTQPISQLRGDEAIGTLLDIICITNYGDNVEVVYIALTLCLNSIKSGEVLSITIRQHKQLCRILGENCQTENEIARPEFCISALRALSQVGDTSAIPLVEKITIRSSYTVDDERVLGTARECLSRLRIRAGLIVESENLLRASHAEAARPDTLLRPASGAGQTAAQELLRPSDEESGP